jgi:SAM-dependent methyltransferase
MVYSHYSEYMAMSMSSMRPSFDEGERGFLQPYLASNEQPFLELACGYGRLLLPIMEMGYSIVGTDASEQMLARCTELARERGLKPDLRHQFMQRLHIDREFGLIFIDDCTFTLVIEDDDAHELFSRVWNHLKPGGTFLFDFYTFNPDRSSSHNEVSTGWAAAPDGAIFVGRKISSYDARTGVTKRLQIHDRYVDGAFIGSQAYEDPNRDWDPDLVVQWLKDHGFVDVRLGGYHTDQPPELPAEMVSVRCRKPT